LEISLPTEHFLQIHTKIRAFLAVWAPLGPRRWWTCIYRSSQTAKRCARTWCPLRL